MTNFQVGNIFSPFRNWRKTVKDQVVLNIIQHGSKLRIEDKSVTNNPFEHPNTNTEKAIKDGEIQKLLQNQVIQKAVHDTCLRCFLFSPNIC